MPLLKTLFVLDTHLGRLAAYLRMLGFDTLYRNDYDDPELARISVEEHRILLTCDRQLLMRRQITHGYFVRSRQSQQQLLEVLRRFDLFNNQQPFTRCMECNGTIHPVNKQIIEDALPPDAKKYYNEFFQCEACRKIYWKGSHYQKMNKLIEKELINSCIVSYSIFNFFKQNNFICTLREDLFLVMQTFRIVL